MDGINIGANLLKGIEAALFGNQDNGNAATKNQTNFANGASYGDVEKKLASLIQQLLAKEGGKTPAAANTAQNLAGGKPAAKAGGAGGLDGILKQFMGMLQGIMKGGGGGGAEKAGGAGKDGGGEKADGAEKGDGTDNAEGADETDGAGATDGADAAGDAGGDMGGDVGGDIPDVGI